VFAPTMQMCRGRVWVKVVAGVVAEALTPPVYVGVFASVDAKLDKSILLACTGV
jgi:hypothetical protein